MAKESCENEKSFSERDIVYAGYPNSSFLVQNITFTWLASGSKWKWKESIGVVEMAYKSTLIYTSVFPETRKSEGVFCPYLYWYIVKLSIRQQQIP